MTESVKYAINGIKDALKSEPNLSIHFFLGGLALMMAYFFDFNYLEWAILILIITGVIVLELINTVVEKIVDFISIKRSEKARVIKDISAAVVLLGSASALIVGAFLFISHL